MSLLRGLAAGAAGAAAYNIYHDTDLSTGKDLASGLFEAFQRKGAAQVAELSRMHRQVDDLQAALLKALHDKTQPTVVVQGSSRASGGAVTGAVVVVGGVVLYLRFVRGWQFSDMMYVTAGAMSKMQQSLSQALSTMRDQVEAATADLVERLSSVTAKQDEMLDKQEELDGQLREVGETVEQVHGGVAVLQQQVAYTNHAITALCGAVSEVAKRVGLGGGRAVRTLDGLVHGAPLPQRLDGSGGGGGGGAAAAAALPGVEGMLLLEAGITEVEAEEEAAAPRPNPAVFAINGSAAGGSRAAAAVAAGAVPRVVAGPPAGGGVGYGPAGSVSFSGVSAQPQQGAPTGGWGHSSSARVTVPKAR